LDTNSPIIYGYDFYLYYTLDLLGNFTHTQMRNSVITDALLDSCKFIETDLKNIKYSRYPDFEGHSECVFSVAFSSDGKYLVSGSKDNTIKLWGVESQQELATLHGHSNRVISVVFSPDGKYLASGSYDETIRLWNVESRKEVAALQGHTREVTAVAYSPDGSRLASSSLDKMVKLWNILS
jgi:WD40 repeat protein